MKNSKIWKTIWIIGIYIVLFIILGLVVVYKVRWEDKDLNTYLYFYDCNRHLCTSTTQIDDYYSKVLCENGNCPYIKEINDDYNVILEKDNVSYIYNYKLNKIINHDYVNYKYLNKDLYIITDFSGKQGIMSADGKVIVAPQYEYVDDFNDNFVSYKISDFYGIENKKENISVNAIYDDIVLINSDIYGAKSNGKYNIYYYKDNVNLFKKYTYLESFGDVLFVIYDNKIDILTNDLKSTLLMKITTFYEYEIEKERESLNLYSDGENIYFNVFINENEFVTYKYNILTKKFI